MEGWYGLKNIVLANVDGGRGDEGGQATVGLSSSIGPFFSSERFGSSCP